MFFSNIAMCSVFLLTCLINTYIKLNTLLHVYTNPINVHCILALYWWSYISNSAGHLTLEIDMWLYTVMCSRSVVSFLCIRNKGIWTPDLVSLRGHGSNGSVELVYRDDTHSFGFNIYLTTDLFYHINYTMIVSINYYVPCYYHALSWF